METTTTQQTESLFAQLNAPFEYDAYGLTYDGQVYLGQQAVSERLNQVFGVFGWEMDIVKFDLTPNTFMVSILGSLRVWDEARERWISRNQFGNDGATVMKDESEPRGQAWEDAKKGAVSDALKKCASLYGVGSDVFRGKFSGVKPKFKGDQDNPIYQALISKLNLDPFDDNFSKGIVILPDHYKEHYESKGWFGVFESDLKEARQSVYGNSNRPSGTGNAGASNGGPKNESSKKPKPFRIKAASTVATNQDGSGAFQAWIENGPQVNVQVPSTILPKFISVVEGTILNVSGWHWEEQGNLNVAKNSKVEIETMERQAS